MQSQKNETVARLILAITKATDAEIVDIYAATFPDRPRLSPSEAGTRCGEIVAYLVFAGPQELQSIWNIVFPAPYSGPDTSCEQRGYLTEQEEMKDLMQAALLWARRLYGLN
jgi:hypothetical protein